MLVVEVVDTADIVADTVDHIVADTAADIVAESVVLLVVGIGLEMGYRSAVEY